MDAETDTCVDVGYWTKLDDGRIECNVCPRFCKVRPGQRGLCFVRRARGDGAGMELTGYGRSTGFCVDPIEKKPLNHFLRGSAVLSFGTAGSYPAQWVARELRADVPLHFTAFHPDYHMRETEPTPPPTLQKARAIAIRNGLHHVYVGNVHDPARQATLCPTCGAPAIARDGYTIKAYTLDASGACLS